MTREQRYQQFIQKAVTLHGDKFDYSESQENFVNAKTPITIGCKLHGKFKQTPDQHIRTYNTSAHKNTGGCPVCSQASRTKTRSKPYDQFVIDARKIHGDRYDYSNAQYINTHTKVSIICHEHGPFNMTPKDHIVGMQGCRECCYRKHFSGKAIRWLEMIERKNDIILLRIGRGKEFKIPNTRYHVDGFHPDTNAIYEFYGDRFHGNPTLFAPSEKCHPFDKNITAGELYDRTMSRESELRALGYDVISVWESEFTP